MRNAGIVIITYKRADRVFTLDLLKRCHSELPYVLLLSDDDPTIKEYEAIHGADRLRIIHREPHEADLLDNFGPEHLSTSINRNKSFDIARSMGWTHFLLLDDDYYVIEPHTAFYRHYHLLPDIKFDELAGILWDFLDDVPSVRTIALAQTGDSIGGDMQFFNNGKRKAMNFFALKTDRPVTFRGRMNEDVNTYYLDGIRGDLYFQTSIFKIKQKATQMNPGGLTELYRAMGTYAKSFYSFLLWPGNIDIEYSADMNRVHHKIKPYAYPMILREESR